LTSLPSKLQVLGTEEYSLPHTVFSSPVSLNVRFRTVKIQLDRT